MMFLISPKKCGQTASLCQGGKGGLVFLDSNRQGVVWPVLHLQTAEPEWEVLGLTGQESLALELDALQELPSEPG